MNILIQKIQDWLWQRVEIRTRQRIVEAAFKQGRFVLRLHLRHHPTLEVFTPLEEEARYFFERYMVPVIFCRPGILSNTSWSGLPGVVPPVARITIFLISDVTRIEVLAPDAAYRDRLDRVIGDVVGERAALEKAARDAAEKKERSSDSV